MIGYTCKYTPTELIAAFGGQPVLLDREEVDFERAEGYTHANLCCHAKSLIQQGMESEELVLVDCCDSLRRAFDVLDTAGNCKFLHFLDLPHEDSSCAKERLRSELLQFAHGYEKYTGQSFSRGRFLQACAQNGKIMPQEPFLAVLGARVSPPLLEMMQDALPLPVVNLTCSGNRNLEPAPVNASAYSFEELMDWYAGALLRMIPCMRMANIAGRRMLTENEQLRGIIYNTVKFCDYYGFDYAQLKETLTIPILKIESDYMPQPPGQLSTRLEAFAESLGLPLLQEKAKGETKMRAMHKYKKEEKQRRQAQNAGGHFYAGIDSGSTTTNMVVIDENRNVMASAVVRTGAKAQNGAEAALRQVCHDLHCGPEDFFAIVATGYGRNNIPFATSTRTEITCHARGAHFLNPEVRTIVDIGGQDSKVICLDETGAVKNFIMNDKCAAGTGRFLEMMARTLELDLTQMSAQGLNWKKDLTISSMCTVFAESEVISLIADNHTDSDIIHGLNKSIAAKTASMVSRAKGCAPYMMTGGVARNRGVVKELESRLGAALFITEDPDLCGALGAALFAAEE